MAALAQCDAFAFIYDQAGDPAPDVLVVLKRVLDASGNPILLGPKTTTTDSAGSFHFTLPEDAAATISARASGLWNCPDGRVFKVPPGPTGELIPTFLLPGSSSVVPPLIYVSDTLSLPRSSLTADGYLAAADYVRFDAATTVTGGVSSFAARTGDIVPVSADYQAFYLRLVGGALTGPLTLAADPTMPMQAATMQYVLAQLASATAGVASFNSRTGVVTPLSADYASFYAPVAHSHTRSQITDLGVFSTSQPGLVPQPTGGDAAKVLSGAGTWITATGGTATAPPATWYVADFKASGSKLTFTGTIASGTLSTLTLTGTPTPDFAVGQGIFVTGAGVSGAALVTTVAAIAGNVITLQTAATAPVTSVLVQHDDSAAINAALQAVVDAKGGTLYFAPGTYNVNGPVLTSHNSIIRLPYHSTATPGEPMIAVSMIGQPNAWCGYRNPAGGTPTVPQTGVIFQTQVRNTTAAIFAATAFPASFGFEDPIWYNHITLYMDGFVFRTYADPQISALDLGGCDNIQIRNIVIDTGVDWYNAVQPTHTGIFGLRTPAVSSGMANDLAENIGIFNYYIGCWFGEMLRANLIQVFRCMVGFQAMPSLYGSRFYSALGWHCPTYVYIGSGGPHAPRMALDMSIDIEYQPTSGSWDFSPPGHDFFDPSDGGTGFIRYMKIPGDSIGSPAVASITGFSKCDFLDLQSGKHLAVGTSNLMVDGPATISGSMAVDNLTISGNAVTFGANSSATAAGYRELQVPNIVTGGERTALWAAGAGVQAPLPGSLTTGLTSFWNLDDATGTGAVDSHGSNNLTDAHGNCTSVAGHIAGGTALGFTANRFCQIASNPSLSPGFSSFTLSAWVYLADKAASYYFLTKAGGSPDEYALYYDSTEDNYQFFTNSAGTYQKVRATSFGSPPINTWTLLVAWYDATAGTLSIQINNGPVNTLSAVGPVNSGSLTFCMGSYGAILYMEGRLDACGFWSRVLTA